MVHIKKAEIFGFKSFGFRNTTVEFQPGLVSISGPNGSGKSNVLDAIIFALGENKPRMMRVSRLGNLLNDSGSRRPGTRMARCSVHFDNSDRKIPIDSDRVKITREMDEKGENTYYLNDKKMQRSQMLNLLETANATLGRINTIQQGTVTKIAEASQDEIREFIEDLAGLTVFDEKKEDATRQLDDADRKLCIVLAKTNETKKRVEELEEERNFKLRSDMLESEIRNLKAVSAANRLVSVTKQAAEGERQMDLNDESILQMSGERDSARAEINALSAEKTGIMKYANEHQQAKAGIEREISESIMGHGEADAKIRTSAGQIAKAEQRCQEIERLVEGHKETQRSVEAECGELGRSIAGIDTENDRNDLEIKSVDGQRTAMLEEQSLLGTRNQILDKKIDRMRSSINRERLILAGTESKMQEAAAKARAGARNSSSLMETAPRLKTAEKELRSFIEGYLRTIQKEGSMISELEGRIGRMSKEISDIGPFLEMADRAATGFSARIKTIKSVMHEDYSISKLRENAEELGIHGLVYEVLSWEKEYERAVLAAGSDWIKAVVVRDFGTLLSLSEYARSNRLPKIKMIPYGAMPPPRQSHARGNGVLGSLADFIQCDPKYSSIKEFLFGGTALVRTAESALAVSRAGMRVVSLEGDLFEPRIAAAVVDSNSKIAKLTRAISMGGSVEDLLGAISKLREYLRISKSSLERAEESVKVRRGRLAEAEKRLAAARQVRDMSQKSSELEEKISELGARRTALREKEAILRIRAAAQRSWIKCLAGRQNMLDSMRAPGAQKRIGREIERLTAVRSGLESTCSNLLSRRRDVESDRASAENRSRQAGDSIGMLQEERQDLVSTSRRLQEEMDGLERKRTEYGDALVRLRGKEQEMISTSGNSMGQIQEYDAKLEKARGRERQLTRDISSIERKTDAISRDLKELGEKASELRQLAGGAESRDDPNIDRLLKELRTELEGMPTLNAKSPEDYTAVSGMYRSMSDRKNTLQEERNAIVGFINSIESEKRQTFLEAFDLVNRDIRNTFSKATGGNAWLELQDEDNIFESGVAYMIQFPNEPKRESTEMSGGEKTLAAIIFVLALQRLNPSPFYLFDEVDAALDAPNSGRLSKILAERSSGSQFIIVSLKDMIVQKADLIYGVYSVNGVSHMVVYKDRRRPTVRA